MKLQTLVYLTEVAAGSGYPYEVVEQNANAMQVIFYSQTAKIEVWFEATGNRTYYLDFFVRQVDQTGQSTPSYDNINVPDRYKILSTIKQIVTEFVQQYKPVELEWNADSKRSRVYSSMIKRALSDISKLGYEYIPSTSTANHTFRKIPTMK